jgi:hypothetical protein
MVLTTHPHLVPRVELYLSSNPLYSPLFILSVSRQTAQRSPLFGFAVSRSLFVSVQNIALDVSFVLAKLQGAGNVFLWLGQTPRLTNALLIARLFAVSRREATSGMCHMQ